MAKIIGCINTSHVPAIGRALAMHQEQTDYWKPFFDGFPPIREWLSAARPDIAVMIYNDHGLNFFLDKMPTFSVGAASVYQNSDEGWGIPTLPPFAGNPDLSWHLIESLVDAEFDITSCQEMLVDHAFTLPMKLLWPDALNGSWPVTTVPVCVNTVQHPLPSPKRCADLGRAIGEAIRSWETDCRVVIIGSGGLSHQLDGQRAGFINKRFDLEFMESLACDPSWATRFSIHDLVELSGTQGVELLTWLAARSALSNQAQLVHSNYHIPISNTAAGTIAFAEPC